MDKISILREKARSKKMTIALPEFTDERMKDAIPIIEKEGLANVFVPTPDKIDTALKDKFIQEYYELRKAKGIDLETAKKTLDDPLYYAAMLTRNRLVDGFVAGAVNTTPNVARAAIHCLGIEGRFGIASSCFIMYVPDCELGEQGLFIYADCGIIPDPNARQLACIAVAASELGAAVLGMTPRVALLSYSTKGSASGKLVDKIVEALQLLKTMAPDLAVDGEFQVDTAIVPEVAKIKFPDSPVAGKANVLIFPNLEAGNIGYKLTQRLANARALGPLFLGLNRPCSDLSRGCSVDDIVDCVAVTAVRAQ